MRFGLWKGVLGILVAAPALAWGAPAQAQQAPQRALVNVAGDLYRWQNNFHYGVVYDTPDGLIVGDTINADASRWLKGQLAERFPGKQVKYVIFSHEDGDHASGGEVFADTATFVMHEKADKLPLRVDESKILRVGDRHDLALGGKVVELHYFGRNHSDSLIFPLFRDEKVLFVVDLVTLGSVGFRDFPNADIDNWIESLKKVEALDFNILVPGHGRIADKGAAAAYREYKTALRAAVKAQIDAGKSLDEIKDIVKMEDYKSWGGYERMFALNVEGMYRHLMGQ